jgi:RHS repeat-associated protein
VKRISVSGLSGEEARTDYVYDTTSTTEQASGAPNLEAVSGVRGNLITETRWLSGAPTSPAITRSFFDTGNLRQETDPRSNSTTLSYACNAGALATITNPLSHVTTITPDCSTLNPSTVLDANGVLTTFSYVDPLDRITGVTRGSYQSTAYIYQDAQKQIVTHKDKETLGDGLVQSEVQYDGLGRTVLTKQNESGDAISVATLYNAFGSVKQVSNPYRGSTASGWTSYEYDALGRGTSVTTPDGAVTQTEYDAATVTVTDPSTAKRRTISDALGRITSVVEAPTTLAFTTSYLYDARDNLKQVTQGTQSRSFTYDSLSRLITATNPETGLICYGEMVSGSCQARYDENGNLLKKTDARGVVTTMPPYDALNRIKGKSYSDGTPPVTFSYDTSESITGAPTENKPIGRLTLAANSVSTARYRYDGLGRPLASMQSPASGGSFAFLYTHKPAGPASMTYPSGRVVNWGYDVAARTVSAIGSFGGQTAVYANNITYAPHGAISSMPIENGARTEKWCYNSRMQPVGIRLGTSTAANCDPQSGDLLRLTFGYGTTNNNGNVRTQDIYRTSAGFSASQSYTYDGLNRLRTMAESVPIAQTYVYDRYGNRAVLSSSYIPIAAQSPNVSSDTESAVTAIFPSNRWSGGTHDPAGNQIARYGGTFLYDAENRVTSSTVGSVTTAYAYDGESRRVTKSTGGSTTTFVYDVAGNLAAEYGGTPSTTGRQYLTADHLGSTRLVTSATGGDMKCSDYLPFGEELGQGINGRGTCYAAFTDPRQKFTGKERDAETGLDYFGARYMSAAQGRFTSPDAPFADQFPENPQSWNLYSYTRNNPLRYVDDDGRGVKEGVANWVDRTGFAFVSLVLEPDKTIPRAASAVWNAVSNPGDTLRGIGAGLQGFANASLDDKVTIATEVALDVVVAGGVGRGVRAGTAATELGVSGGEVVADLGARAKQIHGALDPIAQTKRTTAVAHTINGSGNTVYVVGSSSNALTPAQRAVLKPGEVAATGSGHAERTVINHAKRSNQRVTSVGASRPICPTCEDEIRRAGGTPGSPTRQ